VKRKVIEIDESKCDGCGLCVVDCEEGALEVIDGKARVVSEVFCDGLGACIGSCPTGALKIVEREAEEFSEEAVESHLSSNHDTDTRTDTDGHGQTRTNSDGHRPSLPAFQPSSLPVSPPPPLACGCPGTMSRVFLQDSAAATSRPAAQARSELSQWPIQLRLVPTSGPLYVNRNLVLMADCVAAADPDVHSRLIKGNSICLSCPKLDDARESIEKLAIIFRNPLRSITVAIMEVPCCSGLVRIAREALLKAESSTPLEVVRIGIRGDFQQRYPA